MKLHLRNEKGSKMRTQTVIPGVLYGKGIETTPVSADALEFDRMFEEMGRSRTFEVTLEGKKHVVYIREMQPRLSNHAQARHFDLVKVSKDDTMVSKVQVNFLNKSFVEKQGLNVNSVLDGIEIEYAVGKGISEIDLDVKDLGDGDTLLVSDLIVPKGVKILSDSEEAVVRVSRVKEEKVEDLEEDTGFVEVEAIKQSKDEE